MVGRTSPFEGADRPRVSIVIATRDRPLSLHKTLDALVHAVRQTDEIIVVDSASSAGSTRYVAREAGVAYHRVEQPGASRARNVGARAATGDVLAFTDDDCRPRAGWADAFAVAFVDPTVGLAVGPVTGGSAADVADRGAVRWRWPADPAALGSGASMALRRSAFDSVGGFDERLGPGATIRAGEDHELFLRILRADWAGAFAPDAAVHHDDQRSRMATLQLFFGYGIGAGAVTAMARSLDHRLARRLLIERLGTDGVGAVARNIARRWEEPAARAAAMTAGVVVGRVRARRLYSRVPPSNATDPSTAPG